MLTEHILIRSSLNICETLLHVLDIYNDAADRALRELKQQFMYDEIAAEASLCFDQFLFLLSEQIYGYYKNKAALMVLDKEYKDYLGEIKGVASLQHERKDYQWLMQQNHIQVKFLMIM